MCVSIRFPISTRLRDRQSHLVQLLVAAALATPAAFGQGGFEGPGVYEILNKNSGKVVDLDRNDESTVIQFESRRTDNQQWEIRPAEQGFFFVINMMNGYALEGGGRKGDPAVGRAFTGTTAQQWRFEEGRDGTVLLVNREGLALDVPGDSKSSGKRLQVTSRNDSAAQRFLLRFIGEADPFGNVEDVSPSAPPQRPAPVAPSTPPPSARPAPPDAEPPYLPAPACHEAIRAEVRRRYGSQAYLVYPSAAEQQDRGQDRLNGRATVRTGGQSEEVEYNCLGDPLERRIEWFEIRRTGSGAR